MAVVFNLIDQDALEIDDGTRQISVRELLREGIVEEITMYTPSKPEAFPGLLHPGGIFVLVDGHHVESLDETVTATGDTRIEVVRLVQLQEDFGTLTARPPERGILD